jgi:hypothetical protein
MEKEYVIDEAFFELFDGDFYINLMKKYNLKNRKEAKLWWDKWLNHNKQITDFKIANDWIRKVNIHRIERDIWINVMNYLPIDWAILMFDGIIVKEDISEWIKEIYNIEVTTFCI